MKRLIAKYGRRFDIKKKLSREPYSLKSLRSYWYPPSAEVKRSVRSGSATFEQIMQVEIEEWTREISRFVGPDILRERLL